MKRKIGNELPDDKKALIDHMVVSSTTVHGWQSALIGLPFVGFGGLTLASAINLVRTADSKFFAPRFVVAGFGALFLFAGLVMIAHGLLGLSAQRTIRHKRRSGVAAWFADHDWNADGIKGSVGKEFWQIFQSIAVITIFFVPFHLLFLPQKDVRIMAYFIFGIIDLMLSVFWVSAFYRFFQFLRFGNSYLKFDFFPYFLGGELKGSIRLPRTAIALKELRVVLRYVREYYIASDRRRGTQSEVVSYEIYSQKMTIPKAGEAAARGESIPILFELPNDPALVTALSDRPAKYWEIEAFGKMPGIDYKSNFFVPVYSRS